MRKALVQTHLWLGLVVGLLWALQGLTGAALVFHRELDRRPVGAIAQGPMASFDRLIADTEARTGAEVTMVGIAAMAAATSSTSITTAAARASCRSKPPPAARFASAATIPRARSTVRPGAGSICSTNRCCFTTRAKR
jgi:uncharacterized iron-regulated membrane protein